MNPERHGAHPQIARIWRGRTTAARADEYAAYLYEHGIKPLEKKALGVQMLREDRDAESEFVTISYWESVEAMSRFAGTDPAAHPPSGARRRVPDRAAARPCRSSTSLRAPAGPAETATSPPTCARKTPNRRLVCRANLA